MPSSDSRISGAGSSIAFNQTSGGHFINFGGELREFSTAWPLSSEPDDVKVQGSMRPQRSFRGESHALLVLSQLYAAFRFGIGSAVANVVHSFSWLLRRLI